MHNIGITLQWGINHVVKDYLCQNCYYVSQIFCYVLFCVSYYWICPAKYCLGAAGQA